MNEQPSPEEARELLKQAAHAESTARLGAGWPQIAGLLSLGAASSLALPALAYVPAELILVPMLLLGLWFVAIFTFMGVFSRSAKRGFGRRWVSAIIIWGVLWVISMVGTSVWFEGQAWFVALAGASLAVVTIVGAWIEAKQ